MLCRMRLEANLKKIKAMGMYTQVYMGELLGDGI